MRHEANIIILDKVAKIINQMLLYIAGCFMMAMIFLASANVFFRLFWGPVRGTFELMGYFGAVVTAFALGFTQTARGHIAVDVLVQRFSKRTQRTLNSINYFICMIFFGLVAWQIGRYATTLWETGEVTETLQVIYFPFTYAVAFGCAALCLVFLTDFLKCLLEIQRGQK